MVKTLKQFIILFSFLSCALYAFGQHEFGVKVNGGISRISDSYKPTEGTFKILFVPSGDAGFYYHYSMGIKAFLGAELLFNQIEGKQKNIFDLTDTNGNNVGQCEYELYRHISYLSLPVFIGYKFNKFTFNIGAQVSLKTGSSGRSEGETTFNGDELYYNTKYDELNIDTYDFGPIFGLTFKLSDKITIDANYYYGLNNILKNQNSNTYKSKIQQITIGMHCKLFSKERLADNTQRL